MTDFFDNSGPLVLSLPTLDLSSFGDTCSSPLMEFNSECPSTVSGSCESSPELDLSKIQSELDSLSLEYGVEQVPENFDVVEYMENKIKTNNIEDPFYVIDLGIIKKKLVEWRRELPRVEPFYAMKCNPHPAIVRTLCSFGIGFDCASKTEISTIVDNLKVSPDKVIFANPCKPPLHLQYAKERGVDMMTFDNIAELNKIKKYHPTAKLVLRVLTDDSSSICRFGSKFGAPPNHIPILLKKAIELNLEVVGISFHVGSGCLSAQAFVDAVQYAHRVFHQAIELGHKITILDIGGGFPGSTDPSPHPSFKDIAAALRPVLDDLFPEDLGIRIIAEPGRYFAAESHTLAVCVFARRDVNLEKEELKEGLDFDPEDESVPSPDYLYYVNDGVYGSFNCIFFDHAQVTPIPLKRSAESQDEQDLKRSTIFGPTCDSLDCITKNTLLPKLEVGDWIYFREMGAYTVAAASKFNGFDHPGMFFVDSYIKIYPG